MRICPEIVGGGGAGVLSSLLALITISMFLAPFISSENSCPHSATESKAFWVRPGREPIRSSMIVRSSAYFTGMTVGARHETKAVYAGYREPKGKTSWYGQIHRNPTAPFALCYSNSSSQ